MHDLIIERNGSVTVYPAGTLITENNFAILDEYITDHFMKNIEIIEENVNQDSEQVEGAQTDVDDFDMHGAFAMDGRAFFRTYIPVTEEFKRLFEQEMELPLNAENLKSYIGDMDDLHDYNIVSYFTEESDLEGSGHSAGMFDDNELKVDDNDGSSVYDIDFVDNAFVIKMQSVFNRIVVNKKPYYKGGYRAQL